MARKKLAEGEAVVTSIEDSAAKYIEAKKDEGRIKKIVSSLNSELKSYFAKSKDKEIEAANGKVVYSERSKVSFDEESLIEYAKKENIDIVKTKEYIDFDSLETLLYNESLSSEQISMIDSFKHTEKTPVLTVKKG